MLTMTSGASYNAAAPGRHFLRQLRELPILLPAWLIAYPIGRIFPRNRALIAVIGREDGQFSDNAKYFFIHGAGGLRDRCTMVFVTEDRRTRDALLEQGAAAVLYPSCAAFRLLLRAGAVVADSWEWVQGGRYHLAAGAKRLQLWHGVPLKAIERANLKRKLSRMRALTRLLYRIYVKLYARYPRYDLVVSTSGFFTAASFGESFDAARVVECGYPRNDLMAPPHRNPCACLASVNCDDRALARMRELRGRGQRVVLYAPTFRTRGRIPSAGEALDYAALQLFAERNRLCIVLKRHPLVAGGQRLVGLSHIVEYQPRGDIYPALPEVDLLVTDYSSIFFDFLLLDRPIVFFPYDLDEYQRWECGLLFEYRDMAPGPVTYTQEDLQREILVALDGGQDAFAAQRARVRSLAFDHAAGGAAERIWAQLDRILNGGPAMDCTT